MKTPNDLIQTLESALAIAKGLEPKPTLPKPLPDGYELFEPNEGDTKLEGVRWIAKAPGDSWDLWKPQWTVREYDLKGYIFARPIQVPWTLPPPPAGQQWHRTDGWSQDMLPEGYRPLLASEMDGVRRKDIECNYGGSDENWKTENGWTPENDGAWYRTTRPLPEPPAPPKGWDCIADLGFPWPLMRLIGLETVSPIEWADSHMFKISGRGCARWGSDYLKKYEHSRDGINFSPCHKTK